VRRGHRGKAGLGYDSAARASATAPEFAAFAALRQRRAHIRRRQAAASATIAALAGNNNHGSDDEGTEEFSAANKSVYRVDRVLNPATRQQQPPKPQREGGGGDHSGADLPPPDGEEEETLEDFVGARSSAGFALREDDDRDVYDDDDIDDNHHQGGGSSTAGRGTIYSALAAAAAGGGGLDRGGTKGKSVNPALYESVAYEHVDSDAEDASNGNANSNGSTGQGQMERMNAALSSWADTAKKTAPSAPAATTSDGRPVPSGFVLGSAALLLQDPQIHRDFKGPTVPHEYRVQRHRFGPHECPELYRAVAHAQQLEQKEQQEQRYRRKQQQQYIVQAKPPKVVQHVSHHDKNLQQQQEKQHGVFSSVRAAMQNRFVPETTPTPTATTTTTTSETNGGADGSEESATAATTTTTGAAKQVDTAATTIARTVHSFDPEPLLCKRLHVPVPPKSGGGAAGAAGHSGMAKNVSYLDAIFQDASAAARAAQPLNKTRSAVNELLQELTAMQQQQAGPEKKPTRPSMQFYKSIFDSANNNNSNDGGGERSVRDDPDAKAHGTTNASAMVVWEDPMAHISQKTTSRDETKPSAATKTSNISRGSTALVVGYSDTAGDPKRKRGQLRSDESSGSTDDDDDGDSSRGRRKWIERDNKKKKKRHRRRDTNSREERNMRKKKGKEKKHKKSSRH
jgi:hypothetical protein